MKLDGVPVERLLGAALFAARKHSGQKRKDQITPYINHPLFVAELLARVGGVFDPVTLCAALLHDTLEDTDATPEEMQTLFGKEVVSIVQEVTDDRDMTKARRRRLQIERAPGLSQPARLIRLADKISNIGDLSKDLPAKWRVKDKLDYLEWAEKVIGMIRGSHPVLEKRFDEVADEKRRMLGQ